MADEKTRQFVADMLAKGHSKEDIFAALDKIGARGDSPYKPTQYGDAPAPANLGPSTPANQRATMRADAEEARVASETDEPLVDGGTARERELRAARDKHRQDMADASGFLGFAIGGLAGMGGGSAATALGAGPKLAGAVGGGVGGATQALAEHAAPQDVLTATMLGTGMGAVSGAGQVGEPTVEPPRTQRDFDSVGLARAGNAKMTMRGPKGGVFDDPAYQALPEGEHGTNVLADRAMQTADGALEARAARSQAALNAAENDAIQRNAGPEADPRPLLNEFQNIRSQKMGRAGPLVPEADRRLNFYMDQLRGGADEARPIGFEELNAIRKAANDRLRVLNGTDMSRAGDEQAAGVLSRAVRRFDETGGYLGDTDGVPMPVDGAETAVMQNPNFSPQGQRQITPENGYRALGGVETPTSENLTRRVSMDDMPSTPRPEIVRRQPASRFGDALDAYAAEQEAIKQARGTLGEGEAARNRMARVGSEDQSSPASAVGDARKVEQAGRQIPEAMPFIDQIRARNIAKRRGDFVPPNMHGGLLKSGAQFARHNIDNARFRLNPPKAVVDLDRVPLEPDMMGSIPTDNAPWGIEKPSHAQLRADQLIPLELQLMLMQDRQ